MIHIFIFALSLSFLALGLVFIYKPAWIVRVNKILRERVFNDNRVLLERRKKGFFFLLLFFIFFYWGYYRLQYAPALISDTLISADRLLYQSLQHMHLKQYQSAKTLCERVLARDPANAEALYLLAAAQQGLGDKGGAQESWAKAEKINPNSPANQRLRAIVSQPQNSANSAAK